MKTILGTGQLGLAILDLLLSENPGEPVRLVNRSGKLNAPVPPTVQVQAVDVTDPDALTRVARQSEVIFSCTDVPYPQWATFYPAIADALVRVVAQTSTRLVFADNLYSYGNMQGAVMLETSPHQATTRKGLVRKQVIDAFRHEAVRPQIAIVKASDFIGPRVHKGVFGTDFLEKLHAGKPVYLFGAIHAPHTFTYVPDFARAMLNVAAANDAFGRIWHVPNAPAISPEAWFLLMKEMTGSQSKLSVVPKLLLQGLALFNPLLREMLELAYQYEHPYVVSHADYASRFGDHTTPVQAIASETIAWFQSHN